MKQILEINHRIFEKIGLQKRHNCSTRFMNYCIRIEDSKGILDVGIFILLLSPGFPTGICVLKPVSPEPSQPPCPCFSGALPFSAGSLLVYMNLEKIWNGPRDRFSLFQNFANVCLAAAVTQTLSFPFDTVKRKMQVRRCVWGDLALFVDE